VDLGMLRKILAEFIWEFSLKLTQYLGFAMRSISSSGLSLILERKVRDCDFTMEQARLLSYERLTVLTSLINICI
jgi:hypothetical protein